jgi:hypothetical protein
LCIHPESRILKQVVDVAEETQAAKVRQRHIGDFRQWKQHDAYTKAFDRLLRDLKNAGNSEG